MSKSMCVAKPNFTATIHFTVGICQSAAITKFEERWLYSLDCCDVLKNDIENEGAIDILSTIGIDLNKPGSFVVVVIGRADFEEVPDYEIVELKPVTA